MDSHEIFELVLALINLILGALGFVLWNSLQEAKKVAQRSMDAISSHELYCARTYVTQEGLTQAISNLEKTIGSLVEAVKANMGETRQGFKDLYDKIDTKQDK